MREIIKKGKDFRIIPEKFESATICNVLDIKEDLFNIELPIASADELNDYNQDDDVEIFGSNDEGLVYFISQIIDKNNNVLSIKMPTDYKNIQRREYSRVDFQGYLEIKDFKNAVVKTEDISAGGLKFISNEPLAEGMEYNISIGLSNNLTINCSMQPIRTQAAEHQGKKVYSVSSKFKNIESIDRVALVQYTFRAMTEEENKGGKNP